MIKSTEEEEAEEKMRIMARRGFLSRELLELERSPGWHVLPNGVAVYSDAVALNYLDPSNNFDVEWPIFYRKASSGPLVLMIQD